ncbi:hypothetical protein VI817_009728 [Penicillium citrinum]|nr:hypothetical protein VI817_009728 [Penicillium citrinum]
MVPTPDQEKGSWWQGGISLGDRSTGIQRMLRHLEVEDVNPEAMRFWSAFLNQDLTWWNVDLFNPIHSLYWIFLASRPHDKALRYFRATTAISNRYKVDFRSLRQAKN